MEFPTLRWHLAIQVRHSRRSYSSDPIPPVVIERLDQCCNEFRPFGESAYGVLVTESPDAVFKGLIGSYGKIKGATGYIAFIGKKNEENVEEKVGYVGEGLILEATSIGLNTCWLGGAFKPEVVAEHLSLKNDEKVYAITPIGYSNEKYSFGEKLMTSLVKGRKRKEMEQLCTGMPADQYSKWHKFALENARIAPSAVNRQPWRFKVDAESIIVMVDQPQETISVSKRLDCGIAMLHLETGAKHGGVEGKWRFLRGQEVAKFEVSEIRYE